MTMGNEADHVGGNPLLFQHLFWFFGHPEVYIVALPAFGIVSDSDQHSCAQKYLRLPHDGVGDRHHRCAELCRLGTPHVRQWDESLLWLLLRHDHADHRSPTALKVYNWVLTLWQGNIHLTIPMLFSIAFLLFFINGGMTGCSLVTRR